MEDASWHPPKHLKPCSGGAPPFSSCIPGSAGARRQNSPSVGPARTISKEQDLTTGRVGNRLRDEAKPEEGVRPSRVTARVCLSCKWFSCTKQTSMMLFSGAWHPTPLRSHFHGCCLPSPYRASDTETPFQQGREIGPRKLKPPQIWSPEAGGPFWCRGASWWGSFLSRAGVASGLNGASLTQSGAAQKEAP